MIVYWKRYQQKWGVGLVGLDSVTFWPHSFVEAKLQGLVTLAASPEQKWQDFLNKIVGKHILSFFLVENSGTKVMANWAKQSLLASSLHWLRVILNRWLLGRGHFELVQGS